MSALVQRLAAVPPERRRYLLTTLAQHLLEAGQSARLRQLANEQGWYHAQRTFDNTLSSYASFLDSALTAAENDADGLPDSLIFSLIQTTSRGLVTKLPEPALAAVVRLDADDQARTYATQRTDVADRIKALLVIARAEVSKGASLRARETLRLALSESEHLPQSSDRIRTLCEIATLMYAATKDQKASSQSVQQAFELIKSLKTGKEQSYAFADIAKAARALQWETKWLAATQAIATIYSKVKRPSPDDRSLLRMNSTPPPWEAALFAQEFELMKHPACLVAIAEADRQRSELRTAVLKAAANEHDQAICDGIVKHLLTEAAAIFTRINPPLIEVLAEIGYVDAAVQFISRYLTDDPDDLELRHALARGAGKHGDAAAIIRAAEPIKETGKPRERLRQIGESALIKSVRAIGRFFNVKEKEQVQVLRSGYQALSNHNPQLTEAFLTQVESKFGQQFRQFVTLESLRRPGRRLLSLSIAAQTRLTRKLNIVADVITDGAELVIEAEVDWLIARRQFKEALSLLEQLKADELFAAMLSEKVAREMIALGQIDEASRVAESMTDPSWKQSLLRTLSETAAHAPTDQCGHIFDFLSAQSTRLGETELLSNSNVLSQLLTAFLRYESVSHALPLVESLNPQALTNALPSLAAALETWHEYELAPRLIDQLLKHETRPERKVDALSAMAVEWARVDELKDSARRAYEISYEIMHGLDSYFSDRLALVAHAGRALKDRKGLHSLVKRARREKGPTSISTPGRRWSIDEVLVDATVCFAATKAARDRLNIDSLRQSWFTEMDRYHQAIAQAEIVEEYGEIVPHLREYLLDDAMKTLPLHLFLTNGPETSRGMLKGSSLQAESKRIDFTRPHFELEPSHGDQGVGILVRLLKIVSRLDRLDCTTRIVCATPSPITVPVVLGEAVRQLVWAKRFEDAKWLVGAVQVCQFRKDGVPKWWWGARGDYALKWGEYASLPQVFLCATLPPAETEARLIQLARKSWSSATLNAVVEVAARLPQAEVRRRIITKLLREARERGRMDVLTAIGAVASFADAFMDAAEVIRLVQQTINTEHWWLQPLPLAAELN